MLRNLKYIVFFSFFSTNLLIAQTHPLLKNYNVKFYKLDIQVSDTSTYIEGNVTVNAVVQNNPLDTLVFELTDTLTVDSVICNNQNFIFIHNDDNIIIPIPSAMAIDSGFTATVYYHGTAISQVGVHGWTYGIINQSNITVTNSEAYHSKMWWPCKQLIEDKADSVWVFITTDSSCKAGSVGILSDIVNLPQGKVRYEWKMKHPVAYYQLFFAVGSYFEYTFYAKPESQFDSIPIRCYLYNPPGYNIDTIKCKLDTAKAVIEYLTQLFGEYPFESYGYCLTPIIAHENVMMSSLFPGGFDWNTWFYSIITHMISHQWFAGNVTCKTLQDIWIHEGFASYSHLLVCEHFESLVAAKWWSDIYISSAMTSLGGSVYVPLTDLSNEDRIYDERLSYDKGAALVHMIRFELQNDSVFFDVLKTFNDQFKGSSATGMDFKNVLETISGIDFTDFFNQWYFGEGYPTYNVLWSQSNDTLTLNVNQTTSTATTTLFKMPMEYKLWHSGGDTIIRLYQAQNIQTFKVNVPHIVLNVTVDPNNWVINKAGSVQGITDHVDQDDQFTIYPSITDRIVNVVSRNIYKTISYEVFDVTGNVIEKNILPNNNEIDFSSYSCGVYYVHISAEGIGKIFKIVRY